MAQSTATDPRRTSKELQELQKARTSKRELQKEENFKKDRHSLELQKGQAFFCMTLAGMNARRRE
ncbi:MAG: hypothetical protein ACYCS7_16560 [Acidimicrobiales bacterium]